MMLMLWMIGLIVYFTPYRNGGIVILVISGIMTILSLFIIVMVYRERPINDSLHYSFGNDDPFRLTSSPENSPTNSPTKLAPAPTIDLTIDPTDSNIAEEEIVREFGDL